MQLHNRMHHTLPRPCQNRGKIPKYDRNRTSCGSDKAAFRAQEDTSSESNANQRSALMNQVYGGALKSIDMTFCDKGPTLRGSGIRAVQLSVAVVTVRCCSGVCGFETNLPQIK